HLSDLLVTPRHSASTLFPYTTLFRSWPTFWGRSSRTTTWHRYWCRPRPTPRLTCCGLRFTRTSSAQSQKSDGLSRSVFRGHRGRDRKSTRLNSSHGSISYAVFCLKKN